MMTWMTTLSLFDTAESLALPQLAAAHVESNALFYELLYDDPSDDLGPAPVPLKLMWRGYEAALAAYSAAAAAVLIRHGVTSSAGPLRLAQDVARLRSWGDLGEFVMPPWYDDLDVLRSHRSNLMRRWPSEYSWAKTSTDMPYIWPVVDEDGDYVLRLSKHDKALIADGERSLPKQIMERIDNA